MRLGSKILLSFLILLLKYNVNLVSCDLKRLCTFLCETVFIIHGHRDKELQAPFGVTAHYEQDVA